MFPKLLSQRFIIFIVVLSLTLQIFNYIKTSNSLVYAIDQNKQNIIITFINNQYMVLRADSDIVTDYGSFAQQPFSLENDSSFQSSGFDLWPFSKQYIQQITNPLKFNREIILNNSLNNFSLEFNIKTNYAIFSEYLYVVQLDYSRLTIISQTESDFILNDKNCELRFVKNKDYSIVKSGERSIKILVPYSKNLSFKVNYFIKCS